MKPETCYWDEKTMSLEGSLGSKIRQYLREKRIVPMENNLFEIDPAPGRKQIHTVDMSLMTCTCQGFNDPKTDGCGYITAVRLFLHQVQQGGRDYYEGKRRREEEEQGTTT
jgi:hypothetical protein